LPSLPIEPWQVSKALSDQDIIPSSLLVLLSFTVIFIPPQFLQCIHHTSIVRMLQ